MQALLFLYREYILLMMVTMAMSMGVAMIQGHLSDDFDLMWLWGGRSCRGRACLSWCLAEKMMNRKKHRGKNWETTQSKIKRPILILRYLLAIHSRFNPRYTIVNLEGENIPWGWHWLHPLTTIFFINRGWDLRIDAMIQITCTYLCHIIV